MEKGVLRFKKIFPWFSGFTGDLLFYIAIDTLFLSLVKSFSAAEIVSLTALSQLACILLQFPLLWVMKKIGNTASLRSGAACLLISALLITLGRSYALVLLGRIFHDVAFVLKNAATVALENNLDMIGDRGDFIRVRTSANTVYSVITMLISFVASYMFTLNSYLPMMGCITTCTAGLLLSFFMKDYSDYDRIAYDKVPQSRTRIKFSTAFVITLLSYALFYTLVTSGQGEGKLFIQQQILLDFDEDDTALILGAIVCASRIIRVISNMIFARLYEKYQAKMGVALPTLLLLAMAFMLFGSFIGQIAVKITVMATGYAIILFARDPFKLYIHDFVLARTPKEQHQTLLTVLEFGVKIATSGIGLCFSAILTGFPMIVVISLMLAISVIEILLSLKLYSEITRGERGCGDRKRA